MKTNHIPRARFWVYINCDWVKLSLNPDESIGWSESAPTEEGYRSVSEEWYLDPMGLEVTHEYYSRQRDCDGTFEHHSVESCARDNLRVFSVRYDPEGDDSDVRIGDWRDQDSWQRDHSAEAMGY